MPFPQCSRYLAKTTHTIPRRIVYYEGSEGCSASDEMDLEVFDINEVMNL